MPTREIILQRSRDLSTKAIAAPARCCARSLSAPIRAGMPSAQERVLFVSCKRQ